MKNTLKNIIKIGMIAALFFLAAPFWNIVAVGYVALKAVDIASAAINYVRNRRLSAKSDVSLEQIKKNRERHKINSKRNFFDFRNNQWDLTQLPLDMHPTIGMNNPVTMFTCAGIPNIVKAEANLYGKGAEFSMMLRDEYKAKMIVDHIEKNAILGTRVEKIFDAEKNSYVFKVISDNAVDINEIVHQFYPQTKFEVSRRIEEVKQYVVSGCSSFEEALEEFKRNRHRYENQEANTVTTIQNTVNGVKDNATQINKFIDINQLEAGQYVINEKSWQVYAKNVMISGDMDRTEADLRSVAAEQFETSVENLIEDQCSVEPELSNALEGKNVERVLLTKDSQMTLLTEDSPELDNTGRHILLRFKSEEDAFRVLDNPASLVGKPVLIDNYNINAADYSLSKDDYIVSVPLSKELFSILESKNHDLAEVYEDYKDVGVSHREVEISSLYDELDRKGYATAYVSDIPDLSEALINGVPAREYQSLKEEAGYTKVFEDRLVGDELEAKRRQWMSEMAKVVSADITVDLKKKEAIYTVSIQDSPNNVCTKQKIRQLSDSELQSLINRANPSEIELRDLALKTFPDIFNTFVLHGASMYPDPLTDYINNREGRTVEQIEQARKEKALQQREHNEARKKTLSQNRKKKSGLTL